MRCLKCGTVIPDGGSVCPHCGTDMSVKDTEGVSEAVQEETVQENSSGGIDLSSIPGQTLTVGFKKKDDKEKLFESLGKLALYSAILSAVFNFKTAYDFLSGMDYRRLGSSPEEVYSKFGPALKYLDKSMGIMLVFLGCLCIWGAIAIKKKKKYTCLLVCCTFAVSSVMSLIYNLLVMQMWGAPFDKTLLFRLVIKGLWLAAYIYYFKYFKHEYVN